MREFRPALLVFALFTLVTGVVYPLIVTGIAHVFFPGQAEGSLLKSGNNIVGSVQIGQPFDDPKYFWSRPSATSPQPYNAAASSGSNQGPTNPALVDAVKSRIDALRKAGPGDTRPVPVDLVTASGSGLDPHISPAAAEYQVPRVARLRHLPKDAVRELVQRNTQGRQFGVLGQAQVNVLKLNLALDSLALH